MEGVMSISNGMGKLLEGKDREITYNKRKKKQENKPERER